MRGARSPAADSGGADDDVDNENATAASSLNDVVEGLKDQIFADHVKGAPQTFREECAAFIAAVDWRETWIRCLLLWHLSLWLLFVFTRKNFPRQCGLFFGIAACVALAETLNGLCAKRWEKFATQNYFDERGVFAGDHALRAAARSGLRDAPEFSGDGLVDARHGEAGGVPRQGPGARAQAEAEARRCPRLAYRNATSARTGGRIGRRVSSVVVGVMRVRVRGSSCGQGPRSQDAFAL